MLAALACIGTGQAHIQHPALMMIVDQPDERAGGQLDHDRPLRQIDDAGAIGGVGIQREADLARPGGQDADRFAIPNAAHAIAVEDRLGGNRRIPEAIGDRRALDIGVLTRALRRLRCGIAEVEFIVLRI
jgi:hypothetical protein